MTPTKTIGLFLIIIGAFAFWLESQKKLIPIVNVITTTSVSTKGKVINYPSIGKWSVAVIAYLFLLSFLDQKSGFILTFVILLGALYYNKNILGGKK